MELARHDRVNGVLGGSHVGDPQPGRRPSKRSKQCSLGDWGFSGEMDDSSDDDRLLLCFACFSETGATRLHDNAADRSDPDRETPCQKKRGRRRGDMEDLEPLDIDVVFAAFHHKPRCQFTKYRIRYLMENHPWLDEMWAGKYRKGVNARTYEPLTGEVCWSL